MSAATVSQKRTLGTFLEASNINSSIFWNSKRCRLSSSSENIFKNEAEQNQRFNSEKKTIVLEGINEKIEEKNKSSIVPSQCPEDFQDSDKTKQKKVEVFTSEQVKSIVANAVKEKEFLLRQEFNQIIEERLIEQYQNFSQYIDDLIRQKLSTSTFDYMS